MQEDQQAGGTLLNSRQQGLMDRNEKTADTPLRAATRTLFPVAFRGLSLS